MSSGIHSLFRVVRSERGETLDLALIGVIDEHAGMAFARTAHVGSDVKVVRYDCSGVERINSQGVRQWMLYFDGLRGRGVDLRLRRCSHAISGMLSMFRNFAEGMSVDSVIAQFRCPNPACKSQVPVEINTEKRDIGLLKKALSEGRACPLCKTQAVFDEDPLELFQFIV